jgi:hypothetical protein
MGFSWKISAARRTGIGRQAVTFLLVLAFAFQSYLTQTHIHVAPAPSAQTCAVKCIVHAPAKHSSPADKSTADCPLCQAIVHAGAFFAPAAVIFFVPRLWVEGTLAAAKSLAAREQFSRNGLSRAPPR